MQCSISDKRNKLPDVSCSSDKSGTFTKKKTCLNSGLVRGLAHAPSHKESGACETTTYSSIVVPVKGCQAGKG